MVGTLYIPEEALPPKKIVKPKMDWPHFTPEFVGTQVQTLDLGILESQMELSRTIYSQARIDQAEGRVSFPDGPICIFFIGDVHFGSVFCEVERFLNEIRIIKETSGCYIVLMSNLIDNAIPSQFPSNMLNNSTPSDKQVVAMRAIIEELNEANKILGAVTSPCHEGWTWKHTGQDANALIFGFPNRKFPVLENGARLYVEVGKTTYCLGLFHQVGPFESNFNETHALRQMNRLNLLMEGDIVVGAHRHFATVQMTYEGTGKHLKTVAYIRTGTYKGIGEIHDQWTIGRYGSTGEPSAQSTILWPERKIAVNLEFETGIELYKKL